MVELQLPKLTARVRFPSPAPIERHSDTKNLGPVGKRSGWRFRCSGVLLHAAGFGSVKLLGALGAGRLPARSDL